MSNVARRDFFVSFAAILAGLVLPSLGPAAGEVSGNGAGRLLTILVPDSAAAGRLGRAYLTSRPAENDLQQLVDAILGPLRLSGGADAVDSTPKGILISKVRRVVKEDYVAGRVVDIDGWVLSLTEARLYALAALANGHFR